MRRFAVWLVVAVTLTSLLSISLAAQGTPKAGGGGISPLCVSGCLPNYEVQVTPDGDTLPTATPFTSGTGIGIHHLPYAARFYVYNEGQLNDTYETRCTSTGTMVCDSVRPASISIPHGTTDSVYAYYHVDAAGTGKVTVAAEGEASDTGYQTITVAPPGNAPLVSTAPENGSYRNVGACVASCFYGTWAHSTPAYFTMGQAHALTLAYNSATASPVSTIALDVSSPSGYTPTAFGLQLKLASSGVALTLLNGATSVYYAASDTQTNRAILTLDDRANGLATGGYDVLVTVTSYFSGGSTASNTVEVYLLVVDQGGSAFGSGVDLAGLQRAYIGTDGSVLVTEGDGSAAFYRNDRNAGLVTPGGTSAALVANGDGTYTRAYLDGSWVKFNSSGRQIYAKDQFNDSTTFTWSDTLLTRITDPKHGMIIVAYDGTSHKITQVRDSLPGVAGRKTTYLVSSGKLTTITDPDSLYTQFAYDTKGRITGITDRAGQVSNVAYDTLGFVDSTQGPSFTKFPSGSARQTVRLADAETGAWQVGTPGTSSSSPKGAVKADTLRWTVTDPGGAPRRYQLDRFGQVLTATSVLGATDVVQRDTLGRVTSASTAGHNTTSNTWSTGSDLPHDFGSPYLLLESSTYGGSTTDYTYNANLDVVEVSGTNETQDFGYTGALIHKVTTESAGGTVQLTHYYNAIGQDTAVVDALSHRTRWRYDALGNVDTTYDARGARTVLGRDRYGRDTSVTAPLSGTSYTFYDKLNRVVKTRNPYGQEVNSTYDALGRLTRLKDAKSQVYKFAYGPVGLSAQYDLGDTTKADTYAYDGSGRLVRAFTRRGDTISMAYDTLSRLVARWGSGFAAESLAYDTVGLRTVVWNANATDTMIYNGLSQLSRQSQRLNGQTWTFAYAYNDDGRLASRTNTVGYGGGGYDYLSRTYPVSNGPMTQMTDGGVTANLGYSAERLVDTMSYNPTGTTWAMTKVFNKDHADSTQAFSNGGLNGALGGSFQYDSLDRLINQDYNGTFNQRQFRYDSLGRLVNYCDNWVWAGACENEFGIGWGATVVAYQYDSASNRLVAGDSLSWVGPGNRIRRTRNWYYTYDANGDVLTKCTSSSGCASGYKYTWDALGELTTVKNQGDTVLASFLYDALGHRIAKIAGTDTLRFVYDGDQIILDLNGNNSVRTEYGYQTDGQAVPYSIKQDGTGGWTGVAVIDPAVGTLLGIANYSGGSLIKQYAPDPWGRQTTVDTGVKVRLRMAGQEYDAETGLYHMGARYYDPDAGRFLSEDPDGVIGGLNLYAYAAGNPILNRDPNGEAPYYCTRVATDWTDVHTDDDGTVTIYTWTTYGPWSCQVLGGKAGGGGGAGVDPSRPSADSSSTNCQLVAPGGDYTSPDAIALFQPAMAVALTNAFNYLNSVGVVPQITSGYRTPAVQAQMRTGGSGPYPAAMLSWHEVGMAVDINTKSNYFPRIVSAMAAQGFNHWNSDLPHFTPEPAHTSPSISMINACLAASGGN